MNKNLLVKSALLIGLFLMPFFSIAQDDRIFVEEGDKIFNFGDYEDAILFYQLAVEENPQNVRAHYMAGTCFLITTNEKKEAVHYLLKAYALDPEVHHDVLFKIGEGYRYRYEFDRAVDYYNEYLGEIEANPRAYEGLDVAKFKARANRRILECENAKKYIANPVAFKSVNIGGRVNSEAEDYAPTLNKDETIMYFTSKREGSTGGFKDTDNKYFEDIWVVEKEGNEWGTPKNMGTVINTNQHESNIGLSPDGNILYIYHTDHNGDIYYSEKKEGEWTEVKPFGKNINTEYQETSVFHSSNGSYMFFTSSRPGGEGRLDIYVMRKDKKGKWSKPENLSSVVNTEYDEEGPYFDVEHSTLYFSSKGHGGMGGYDLYKSVWDTLDNSWSEPENLGYPVNSVDDELFYTVRGGGEATEHAYYASFKDDSHGYTDIYMIVPDEDESVAGEAVAETVIDNVIEEDPIEIERPKIDYQPIHLNVTAKEQGTSNPISAFKLNVYRSDNKQTAVFEGDAEGFYNFTLNDTVPSTYILMVEADGYVFQSKNISIEPTGETQTKDVVVYLGKQEVFAPKVLRNIYFAFDKHTLRAESFIELDQLVKMLKSNEAMTVEIAGHTDFKGSDDYNMKLSYRRANAVKKYLVKNGINASRVLAKGYGEKYPIASNDDEIEGRELNRRTEFIILTK